MAKNDLLAGQTFFPQKVLSSKALCSYLTIFSKTKEDRLTPQSLRIGGHTFYSIKNMHSDFTHFLARRKISKASQLYYRARMVDNISRLTIFFKYIVTGPVLEALSKNLTCAPPPKIVPLWSKFVGSVIWVFWLFCRQPVCSGVFCWLGGPSVLSIFVGFFCWKTSNIQFYHTGVSLFKILHKLILPDNIQFLLTILTKTKEYPYVFLKIYVSLNSFWEHGFEKNSKDTSWF